MIFGMKECCLLTMFTYTASGAIEATEKFPGGGCILSPRMDLKWGIGTAFRPREGKIRTKISKNSNGVARGWGGGGCLSLDLTDT